jgi:hypothetical protein
LLGLGMTAVIACYRIGARLDLFDTFWGWGVGAFVFLLAAASVPLVFSKSNWACLFVMLGAIPFAVVTDVGYDFFVNHIDRNLFPLEIVFWWVVTPIPTVIGYGLGRYVTHFLRKEEGSI